MQISYLNKKPAKSEFKEGDLSICTFKGEIWLYGKHKGKFWSFCLVGEYEGRSLTYEGGPITIPTNQERGTENYSGGDLTIDHGWGQIPSSVKVLDSTGTEIDVTINHDLSTKNSFTVSSTSSGMNWILVYYK